MQKAVTKPFRPMLAATCEDVSTLKFPVLASPKIDGIRCVIKEGVPLTRNLKEIPNRYVRDLLSGLPPFDGEVVVGDPLAKDVWNKTQSGIMPEDGEPDFVYWVFDMLPANSKEYFYRRHQSAEDVIEAFPVRAQKYIKPLGHKWIDDVDRLNLYEEDAVSRGCEGIMVRDPNGVYKHGRSTVKEGGLLKIKRFMDAEAVVVDVVEKQTNLNEKKTNALGLTERSSHKANKRGAGVMGALVCRMGRSNAFTFELGTGFNDEQRAAIWRQREHYANAGLVVRYKYQGLTPAGLPRFPVFQGWRND